jgi:hypothetical protein
MRQLRILNTKFGPVLVMEELPGETIPREETERGGIQRRFTGEGALPAEAMVWETIPSAAMRLAEWRSRRVLKEVMVKVDMV